MNRIERWFWAWLYCQLLLLTSPSFAQFTFIHISDLHISDANSFVNNCDLNAMMAQCYFKEFAALQPKPAFVIATGDISNIGNNSFYGMYPTLGNHLYPGLLVNPGVGDYYIDSAKTIPIYFTPGNHDYYTTITPPQSAVMHYYPIFISPDTDYAVTKENTVILFMRSGYDDDRPFLQDPNILSPEGSGLTDAQCSWVRNTLNLNRSRRKIIVMHHPPVNVAGTNSDGTPFTGTILDPADGSLLNNRNTFLNICDSNHVDLVLAGHRHQNVVARRAGKVVNENWSDSTRYVQTAPAFRGSYRIITVDTSAIKVSPPLLGCVATYINQFSNDVRFKLSPNPFNHTAILEFAPEINVQHYELRIYTALGIEVKRISNINTNRTTIERGNLLPGIYFYKIYNARDIISTGKFVIGE